MSFDIVDFSLASAVADNGTVTVGYPTGRSKGNYTLSTGKHKLSVNGNIYSAPADFTVAFNANASNITVTNKSGGTWPQSALCGIQLDRAGTDQGRSLSVASPDRMFPLTPMILDLGAPNVADADGICASQTVTFATTPLALINGALAASSEVILDVPRNVVAAWTSAAIITVTGEDEFGVALVEKSASGTSLTGKKAFKKITSVAFSANVTGATVGTGDVLGLPVAINDTSLILSELKDGIAIGRGPVGKVRVNWFGEQVSVLAGTNSSIELISPIAGNISGLTVAVRAAVTTGGNVTVKVATTDVTGLTVAVANSATKGTTASDTPTTPGDASTVVAKGDRIQIVFDDAFATAGALDGYLEITPTGGVSDGTIVAAVGSEATATTGDVRGTYDPSDACDGALGFKLVALLADPTEKGVAQYGG